MAFSGASNPNAQAVVDQPGYLIVDPTDLSASFPYGGTVLGYTAEGVTLELEQPLTPLVALRSQVTPYAHLALGTRAAVVRATLLEWDDDAIEAAFDHGLSKLGSSGARLVGLPGVIPGLVATRRTLLYAPRDAALGAAALFRSVVPWPDALQRLVWRWREPFRLPVAWRCEEKAGAPSGEELLAIGRLGDLVL